ncbi:MAG: ribonuclease P protein component [Verrucomicrobia bacterium]|nr:ribonuclease P protein component [Verrucomicrobiota bacterium]
MKRTLRKRERLQHGTDFRRARYEGRRLTGRLMLLNVLRAEDLPGRRLGVVTSRQFGGAVARNRARRIVREAWRLIQEQLVTPCDVVVVVRRGMAGCAMQEVQEELLRLVKAAGVLKAE